jgi:hypothetical protein
MTNYEPRIAVLACELCLWVAPKAEWSDAIHRLIGLLDQADWRLESDVEECLFRHYPKANRIVTAALRDNTSAGEQAASPGRDVLLRVRARGKRLVRRMPNGS